jgi:N-acetylmuramoyl-L-alanine amidase
MRAKCAAMISRFLRFAPVLLACVVCVLLFQTAPTPAATSRYRSQGTDFVSFAGWARDNQFTVRWLKRDESLLATNRTGKVRISVNSREAWVNDIHVLLLFTPVPRGDDLLVAQRDIETTLRPILFPPKDRSGTKIQTICLDAGHGGRDPGNRVGSRQEKEYTLRLAFELRDQLTKAGYKVTMTRSTDALIDLENRPDIARRQKADLFVSLHFNATESGRNEAHGSEVYTLTPAGARSTASQGEGRTSSWASGNRNDDKNMFLAYQIQRSLVRTLRSEDRGVRRARFIVLRDATMPAVLIEAGFMSHPSEGQKIFDSNYRREMARAIVNGIDAYKRAVQ